MRKASQEDVLEHAAPVRSFFYLQENADAPRALSPLEPRKRLAFELDATACRPREACERVYERALSSAVAAEHRPRFARTKNRVEPGAENAARY
jgi:hypothetical protein